MKTFEKLITIKLSIVVSYGSFCVYLNFSMKKLAGTDAHEKFINFISKI